MSNVNEFVDAFRRGTAPVFDLLSTDQLRQLIQLPADSELVSHIETLADKANEGDFTESERARYEGYIEANNLLVILQVHARHYLSDYGPLSQAD